MDDDLRRRVERLESLDSVLQHVGGILYSDALHAAAAQLREHGRRAATHVEDDAAGRQQAEHVLDGKIAAPAKVHLLETPRVEIIEVPPLARGIGIREARDDVGPVHGFSIHW